MRIGVDLDGVVYQWSETARFLLNWKFGVEVGESTHWDYIKECVTPEQWNWLWADDPDGGVGRGLFRHGHCYKGSFEALKEIDRIGDIVTITHRPKSALDDTLSWLSFNKVATSAVHLLYRSENKSEVRPTCQLYVDDKVANCVDLADNTSGVVCLWDRPWNRSEQWGMSSDIVIIDSWEQFIKIATEIKEDMWQPASLV